jgi:HSP20 family molecular chaperone IbpA
MKIEDQQLQQQVRSHAKNKQRILGNNQVELDQLKKIQESQIEALRQDNQTKIFDEQMKFRADIGQTAEESQQKMLELQKRLQEEKQFVDAQQKTLQGEVAKNRLATEYKMQTQMQEKNQLASNQLSMIDSAAQKSLSTAQMNNERTKASMQSSSQQAVSQAIIEGDKRVTALENRYKQLETGRSQERAQEMSQAEKSHQQRLLRQQIKFEKEMQSMLKSQEKEMKTTQALHLGHLEQEKTAFTNKFQQLQDNHSNATKRVEIATKNEISSLAKENTTLKENYALKSTDPFYQPQFISPEIVDAGDHYVIALPIPEHEKESVHLNADKRNITVQVSRQFKQTIDLPGSNINRSSRNEVFA